MKRTDQQNNAIHKYCRMVADDMAGAGYHDLRHFLTRPFEIPISQMMVKEFIWRPVQDALTGKRSTTKLEKMEVDEVYQAISRHLASEYHITTPFPCEEERHAE